jgi:hypothetical protein
VVSSPLGKAGASGSLRSWQRVAEDGGKRGRNEGTARYTP